MSKYIIDRRKNPKGKSISNRQRFIRRAKKHLSERIHKNVVKRSITDKGEENISIPTDGIQEPTFGSDHTTGDYDFILPGNKDFIKGDKIDKPKGGSGGGGQGEASDSGGGEDEFQFSLSREEYLDIVFEDLELPNLEEKNKENVTVWENHRAGYTTVGGPSQLNIEQSMIRSLGRRIALKFPKEKQLKELQEEIRLEKERAKDIKLFLRKEQAIIRKEQAERQRKFLEELKIEKQIEKFRVREVKELENLEKVSLKEQREDYAGLQERIEKLKEKYRIIRDQKIRERVEALGVQVQEGDNREALLQKEREHRIEREKIESCLESFYRSANSLVFQLNKRHITKHMSIFRCIDRRFETGEIFIKWDEVEDEEWLLLIYIKNNAPSEGIIIEDKSNPEKNITHELKTTEIFKASDLMVDSLTQLLARERDKNKQD